MAEGLSCGNSVFRGVSNFCRRFNAALAFFTVSLKIICIFPVVFLSHLSFAEEIPPLDFDINFISPPGIPLGTVEYTMPSNPYRVDTLSGPAYVYEGWEFGVPLDNERGWSEGAAVTAGYHYTRGLESWGGSGNLSYGKYVERKITVFGYRNITTRRPAAFSVWGVGVSFGSLQTFLEQKKLRGSRLPVVASDKRYVTALFGYYGWGWRLFPSSQSHYTCSVRFYVGTGGMIPFPTVTFGIHFNQPTWKRMKRDPARWF